MSNDYTVVLYMAAPVDADPRRVIELEKEVRALRRAARI